MKFDLVIMGGKVVFPWAVVDSLNIGVTDGTITALSSEPLSGDSEINATDQFVFPGFIDTHTHIGFAGLDDEFATETAGALAGGITTCMIYYRGLEPYGDNLRGFIEQGKSISSVDFGVHLGMLIDDHLANSKAIYDEFGISSFKMYTCYKDDELASFGVRGEDDGFMVDAFRTLAEIPNSVVNVHSENDDVYERRLVSLKQGKVEGTPLQQWSWTRPAFGEAEAIARVALFARLADARVFIPHVGSEAALKACLRARKDGTRLHFETSPHYLVLTAAGTGQVQYAKVNPPIRDESDRQALLAAVESGLVDTIGTDHATIPLEGKVNKPIWQVRPGFPGVDVMVPVLMHLVNAGALRAETLARVTKQSADLFSLKHKGRIEVGYDADFAIIDPRISKTVTAKELESWSDLSVYEGIKLDGWPTLTVLRGTIVAENSHVINQGKGVYLERR